MNKSILPIKLALYTHCEKQVEQRITACQEAMASFQRAANQETKSSAGDKYETTRAMMHLEKEKSAHQLAAAIKDKQALSQVLVDQIYEVVQAGSLVRTSKGHFFIAISAGKITLDDTVYFAISKASPIGGLLVGKRAGDSISFNGNQFAILEIG